MALYGLDGRTARTAYLSSGFQNQAEPLEHHARMRNREPFRFDSLTFQDIISCMDDLPGITNIDISIPEERHEKEQAELIAAAARPAPGSNLYEVATVSDDNVHMYNHDYCGIFPEAAVALDSFSSAGDAQLSRQGSLQHSRIKSDHSSKEPDEQPPSDQNSHSMDSTKPKAIATHSVDSSYRSPPLVSPTAVDSGAAWGRGVKTQQHQRSTPAIAPTTPLVSQRSLASLILSDLQDQHGVIPSAMHAMDEDVRLLSEATVCAVGPASAATGDVAMDRGVYYGGEIRIAPNASASMPTEADAFEAFLRLCGSDLPDEQLPVCCSGAVTCDEATEVVHVPVSQSPAAVDLCSLGRSGSVCASETDRRLHTAHVAKRSLTADTSPAGGDLKRPKSAPGTGTNRPPKRGSVSAQLPAEKLDRKRAAARRYYHNQKNKVVDYEEVVTRLELENAALKGDIQVALEKLEFLKQARGGIAMRALEC
jgi:hypothetical protein